MKIIGLIVILFANCSFGQLLHQHSKEEIKLLNISKIYSTSNSFGRLNVQFNFNGAGFVSRPVIIFGLPYSYSGEADTTYNEFGKIQTINTISSGQTVTNNFYYSDTVVENKTIQLIDSIDFYYDNQFSYTAKICYEFELEPIRKKYNYLLGEWTVCYSFSKNFVSYNPKIDSLQFTRGGCSCKVRKGKFSNSHHLSFFDNDSLKYSSNLIGKTRKVGIPYFEPCTWWTYDNYGFNVGNIRGFSAIYGEIKIQDKDHFWLIFDKGE
ncbi:hypothetical protein K6119_09410 [Paracrocinitomix mangrovi]|uniref:hypothetical protein n=1 Tax=Paracrocinitomix mangrovi TaxID=2862509 RepID=UPI001C8F0A5E|nr:hypothetical protein [Paracrocinitomix mangrovi]UKN03707.1 hypothetical protein K6119_09410 [Paracrocinitomix mangrovi]